MWQSHGIMTIVTYSDHVYFKFFVVTCCYLESESYLQIWKIIINVLCLLVFPCRSYLEWSPITAITASQISKFVVHTFILGSFGAPFDRLPNSWYCLNVIIQSFNSSWVKPLINPDNQPESSQPQQYQYSISIVPMVGFNQTWKITGKVEIGWNRSNKLALQNHEKVGTRKRRETSVPPNVWWILVYFCCSSILGNTLLFQDLKWTK